MCQHGNTKDLFLGGKLRDIDLCIFDIVKALNEGGVETFECCCGHGAYNGTIFLKDGRELEIVCDKEVTCCVAVDKR